MYMKMIPINRPFLGNEEIRAVATVLRSGYLTEKRGSGPYVTRFENAFSKYVGTKFAIAVNSGTSALHAALLAAGIGAGDEVIIPSFTFVATAEAVALMGAKPIFTDIDRETYCLDPNEVERSITVRTKAVIPVHLYGVPSDMDRIMKIAKDHSLTVIEDAAQAHGAEINGIKAGALGDMACFSFYGSKNMTTGEGGMITTNKREYANNLGLIRSHGEGRYYQSITLGHNYRMPEIEAAIGYEQLRKLPHFLEARKHNAEVLSEGLRNLGAIQIPISSSRDESAWYVFTIRLIGANAAKRNKVVEKICERRVDAKVYYPTPIHKMPFYRKNFGKIKLPITETTARQVISLPVHPGLEERDLTRIISAVKNAVR